MARFRNRLVHIYSEIDIYREYTTRNLIVMEFLDGFKPSDPQVQESYSEEDRGRRRPRLRWAALFALALIFAFRRT